MNDEGAKKVIAAILRLTNKVDSLDRMTVEAAAVANEGRQAAMDAAQATNPKQIAAYVEQVVSPTMQILAQETRAVHKEVMNGSWRATHDANELRKIFESERNSLEWQRRKLEELRHRYWFNAFCAAIFAAVGINIIFTWLL